MTKRIVLGLIALAVVALVAYRVMRATADEEPAPDVAAIRREAGVPVEVATAAVEALEVRRSFTGAIRAVRSATIRARTEDEIVEIPARVGRRVREGEVLVRQSSRGSLAAVRQAEAAHEQARRLVERLTPLHERGAISARDWDDANTALRVADANLAAARKNVVLTSPIAGTVTDVRVTVGAMPSAGDPLVRVSDLSRVQVLLQVSPTQARELAAGQEALLAECATSGRVSRVSLQADPETRLVEVEVTFSDPAGAVIPGALAAVEIVVGRREAALVVPQAAVSGSVVWVVEEAGTARSRPVAVGLSGDGRVEILSGLAPGDRVVTAGASLLSDGARVRVVGGGGS